MNEFKYNIGYALSGGFIKGFAHLGIMQALHEHGIRPEILSGVSAGALAAVFYADGKEPYHIVELFEHHSFKELTTFSINKQGLLKLDSFIDFLNSNLESKTIEELKIPTIITATDLDHGRIVSFKKGKIAERLAASCCMPILFAPIRINNTYYVDGGILMNLPVSPIRKECEKVWDGLKSRDARIADQFIAAFHQFLPMQALAFASDRIEKSTSADVSEEILGTNSTSDGSVPLHISVSLMNSSEYSQTALELFVECIEKGTEQASQYKWACGPDGAFAYDFDSTGFDLEHNKLDALVQKYQQSHSRNVAACLIVLTSSYLSSRAQHVRQNGTTYTFNTLTFQFHIEAGRAPRPLLPGALRANRNRIRQAS